MRQPFFRQSTARLERYTGLSIAITANTARHGDSQNQTIPYREFSENVLLQSNNGPRRESKAAQNDVLNGRLSVTANDDRVLIGCVQVPDDDVRVETARGQVASVGRPRDAVDSSRVEGPVLGDCRLEAAGRVRRHASHTIRRRQHAPVAAPRQHRHGSLVSEIRNRSWLIARAQLVNMHLVVLKQNRKADIGNFSEIATYRKAAALHREEQVSGRLNAEGPPHALQLHRTSRLLKIHTLICTWVCIPKKTMQLYSAQILLFSTELSICKLIKLLASIPLRSLMVHFLTTQPILIKFGGDM